MPNVLPRAMRYTPNIEAGNPLPRAVFILVFLVEMGVRAMLGGDSPEAWTLPLLHAGLAWLGVGLCCRAVDSLYGRLCMSPLPSSATRRSGC